MIFPYLMPYLGYIKRFKISKTDEILKSLKMFCQKCHLKLNISERKRISYF